MPQNIYTVELDGKVYEIEGDRAPTEAEVRSLVGRHANAPQAPPSDATEGMLPVSTPDDAPASPGPKEWPMDTPADIMKAGLRWGGNAIASMTGMGSAGTDMVAGAEAHPYLTMGALALPGAMKAVGRALPSLERAGSKFQSVAAAAKNTPVDFTEPGNVALRMMQLRERGGHLPKVVNDYLRRVTDPSKGPMLYEEARDFASNISRLSADEYGRLTPVMQREAHKLRVALNSAVERAATQAGRGDVYRSAMSEYARRANINRTVDDLRKGAKRALPVAGAAGAATWGINKLIKSANPPREP